MVAAQQTLDVRSLAPRDRHAQIFARLAELPAGGSLVLVNDHDPRPLWYQLQAEQPGQFGWTYAEQGPERWRVRIERLAGADESTQQTAVNGDAIPGPYLDNRGLEPPTPMVRILEALEQLPEGQELTAHMDREPLLLYPHLANRGFAHSIEARDDGSYLLRIRREA